MEIIYVELISKAYQLDMGQPVIKRLRIECGGVVLEDIDNYNALLAGILTPAQAGIGNIHTEAFNVSVGAHQGFNPTGTIDDANVLAVATIGQCGANNSLVAGTVCLEASKRTVSNGTNIIGSAEHFTVCYKLVVDY